MIFSWIVILKQHTLADELQNSALPQVRSPLQRNCAAFHEEEYCGRQHHSSGEHEGDADDVGRLENHPHDAQEILLRRHRRSAACCLRNNLYLATPYCKLKKLSLDYDIRYTRQSTSWSSLDDHHTHIVFQIHYMTTIFTPRRHNDGNTITTACHRSTC